MKTKQQIAIFFLATTLILAWSSPGYAIWSDKLTDKEISASIESDLYLDAGVSSHLIDVTTNDGIVTLTGTVDNILEKERASLVAQTIRGVKSVVNQINVVPIQRTDDEIARNVKTILNWDPATDLKELEVQVQDGRVHLKGQVDSWQEKLLARDAAKSVSGVKKVQDELEIRRTNNRTDDEIKGDILGRLRSDVWIYEPLIRVAVNDGNVMFEGGVRSALEKHRIRLLALVPGVKKVNVDRLQVVSGLNDNTRRTTMSVSWSDQKIKEALESAILLDSRVKSTGITADVDQGRVTLHGVVKNMLTKRIVEEDARNTVGVWEVENKIKVRPESNSTNEEIAQHIRDALAFHPLVDRYDISVVVRNKKAHLGGKVDTVFEKKRVEDIVSRIDGVVEVNNQLKTQNSWPFKSDLDIKENIERELWWSVFVDSDDITVNVQNGKAILKGKVESWNELNATVKNAFEGGARFVKTQLQLDTDSNDIHIREYYSYEDLEVWP